MLKKRVTEACFDILSAIWEKNLSLAVCNMFPVTVCTGKLAKILDTIRTQSRKKRIISRDLLTKHLRYMGLTSFGVQSDIDFLEKLKVIESIDENEFSILIGDADDVYNICYDYFSKSVKENNNIDDFNLVFSLIKLIKPQTLEVLSKDVSDSSGLSLQDICEILQHLGLIKYIEEEGMYYNMKFFGENDKKVCDLLSENKNISDDILRIVNRVHDIPGVPAEEFDIINNPKENEQIKAAALLGILDMVNVQTGNLSKDFLFNPNIKKDNKLSLTKETAAYFRFNQIYADKRLGRLDVLLMPTLRKLVRQGVAGEATNIALNYKPLEEKGVFSVEIRGIKNRPCMILQKKDVVQDTISLLEGNYDYSKQISFKRTIRDLIKSPTESRANLSVYDKILAENKRDIVNTIRDGGMR
ncbi:MAG: hypothetical protein ACYTEL_26500 [Planctomycetota bacterium]|jgi:hypothetical protein